jgi:hypothetical protein
MNTPLALPDYSVLAEWTPKVGDLVENFGAIARVIDFDPERGYQLRAIGALAAEGTWRAPAQNCRPVR